MMIYVVKLIIGSIFFSLWQTISNYPYNYEKNFYPIINANISVIVKGKWLGSIFLF